MNWSVIHYSQDGFRVGSNQDWNTEDIYVDGWFVDFIGTEKGCREFLADLDPVEFEYFLMSPVESLKPPTIEEK